AAAAHLALEPGLALDGAVLEEMPEALKARLVAAVVGEAARPALRLARSSDAGSGAVAPARKPRGARALLTAAPWLAAAAALVVAAVTWTQQPRPLDAAVARAALAHDPQATAIAWSQTADPLGRAVDGDVLWSNAKQEGFMRFRGLPANDPNKGQYQLWIFDAERDERYPVDGGVFDVNANGETTVAIRARVPVSKATLFAVTFERPGGVVVSTRERLVALAKVS
ncbi:MAG TPA: anti-sigma factor, partial [Myxococcota bacterium]